MICRSFWYDRSMARAPILEKAVMELLWDTGEPLTPREVKERLPEVSTLAYTTVMTTMARLARKGILQRDTGGLAHRYRPALSRDQYARGAVGDALTWLLDRYPEPAVAYLADVVDDLDGMTLEELREAGARRRAQER